MDRQELYRRKYSGIAAMRTNSETRKTIDIHAHVLPGLDDGARDREESCTLLRMAAAQGIRAVVATPHEIGGRSWEELSELAERIQQEVNREYPDFTLFLGQETFYHEGLIEQLKQRKAFSIAGGRYVLVEFMPSVSYRSLYRGIRALSAGGYKPVLAHVERYRCLRQEENLLDLAGSGCLLQMNYSSLQGWPLAREVRWCRGQVLAGRIDLLGTDMHRTNFRPPEIGDAVDWLEKHVHESLIEAMTWEKPLEIISAR